MKLTDANLLKYVDGHLSDQEVGQIETLLLGDTNAQHKVDLMRASGEALTDLPVDQEEMDFAADLRARLLASTKSSMRTVANDRPPLGVAEVGSVESRSKLFRGIGKIAAALVILAGAGFVGFQTGIDSLPNEDVMIANLPVWVVRVVDYHTLYDRETVEGSRVSLSIIEGLEAQFAELLNSEIIIPDLNDVGLDFRRGQILKFEGQEIIQLAYLPEGIGKPVALCLRVSEGKNSEPNYSKLHGLEVARWRQNGIEYLMLGERSQQQIIESALSAFAQIEHS